MDLRKTDRRRNASTSVHYVESIMLKLLIWKYYLSNITESRKLRRVSICRLLIKNEKKRKYRSRLFLNSKKKYTMITYFFKNI